MKTIILPILILLSFFSPSENRAETLETSVSPYSIRVRPVGLAFGIFGAEFYGQSDIGYYLGLTANFMSGDNSDKNTSLVTREYGVKFGKFFGDTQNASGFWIQGTVNLNNIVVTNYFRPTNQNLSATFNQMSEAGSVGYQFRMTFVNPDRFNTRLGAGLAYKAASDTIHVVAANRTTVPISVRKRLDPSIEFTIGYLL